ncbi:hypothetical protein [Sutcliffiella sp. BMC8]
MGDTVPVFLDRPPGVTEFQHLFIQFQQGGSMGILHFSGGAFADR